MAIHDVTAMAAEDVAALSDTLARDPDAAAYTTLQGLSDLFCEVPADVLTALDALYARHPGMGLRLFSALRRDPVDIANLRALPHL